jgi:alpha-ketoglutarate-dependent taurine dioxygenase
MIFFFCELPPSVGGETPLADCRELYHAIPKDTLKRFAERKIKYIQNLHSGTGIGKSWQETFELENKADVEALLNRRGCEFRWKTDGGIRVSEIVDPIVKHPMTGEHLFFAQAHQWHVTGLDPATREALLSLVKEEDLYHTCCYGDDTPFDSDDLEAIRTAFDRVTVRFSWRRGDFLIVDNLLVAHGRAPFKGERRILVAMG